MTAVTTRPLAIAHRGYSGKFPENTLTAFDAALEYPIDGMEFDVQITADGVPIIFHDGNLRRVNKSLAMVRFRSAEQMARLDYGRWFDPRFSGTGMLDLETFLTHYRGRGRLLLELKIENGRTRQARRRLLVETVVAQVRAKQAEHSVEVLCFDLETLRECHQLAPELPCVLNQSKAAVIADAAFLSAYSCSVRALHADFVRDVHALGKPVYCFTVNDEKRLNHALGAGVDAVMSDHTPWLLDQLAQRFPKN